MQPQVEQQACFHLAGVVVLVAPAGSVLASPTGALAVAFANDADFTPMSPHDPLYVDDVLHQAFVAVDESGTEAAAATAVVMDEVSASVGGNTLVLDRPFLFVIHDTAHGTPLFVGRVADVGNGRHPVDGRDGVVRPRVSEDRRVPGTGEGF